MRKLKENHLNILEVIINVLDQAWLDEKANISSIIDKQLKIYVMNGAITVEEFDIIKGRMLYLLDGVKMIQL